MEYQLHYNMLVFYFLFVSINRICNYAIVIISSLVYFAVINYLQKHFVINIMFYYRFYAYYNFGLE